MSDNKYTVGGGGDDEGGCQITNTLQEVGDDEGGCQITNTL